MTTTALPYTRKKAGTLSNVYQASWQRIMLLIVLGYEALGCLTGGALLVIAPDGHLMDMPVEIMHGAFSDFLIPGIILFALGIITSIAFINVLRKKTSDWFWACLATGGLTIWFVVEIIILQELHWLHLMWGSPVLLAWVVTIPIIFSRHPNTTMQQGLLTCGIAASVWYIFVNVFVPTQDAAYNVASLTVSELSAIGAPTRILWVLLCILYPLLFTAFGWGVLNSAEANRRLRMVGILVIVYSLFTFYWPPMHQREIIAAGGGTLTDTLHLVWASIALVLMMLLMGFGINVSGKRFYWFTIATWIVFIIFGTLTFIQSPGIEKGLPTPQIGIYERINIGAFMIWVIVFAIVLKKAVRAKIKA